MRRQRHASSDDGPYSHSPINVPLRGRTSADPSTRASPSSLLRRESSPPNMLSRSMDARPSVTGQTAGVPLHRHNSLLEASFTPPRESVIPKPRGASPLTLSVPANPSVQAQQQQQTAGAAARRRNGPGDLRPVHSTSAVTAMALLDDNLDSAFGGKPYPYTVHPAPNGTALGLTLARGSPTNAGLKRGKAFGVTSTVKQKLDSDHALYKELLKTNPTTVEELVAMVRTAWHRAMVEFCLVHIEDELD